jgi:hypothetical protein
MVTVTDSIRYIPLTKGQVAIVDAQDFNLGIEHRWRAKWDKSTKGFYAYANIKKDGRWTTKAMHRVIAGAGDRETVDHINRNTLDNQKSNLRIVTRSQSSMNRKNNFSNSQSGFRGVVPVKRKNCERWLAQIRLEGKLIYIGIFPSKTEAAKAYNSKALELFGTFAVLNSL